MDHLPKLQSAESFVNGTLTHVKFLIVVGPFLVGDNVPDACQPVSNQREANLLDSANFTFCCQSW